MCLETGKMFVEFFAELSSKEPFDLITCHSCLIPKCLSVKSCKSLNKFHRTGEKILFGFLSHLLYPHVVVSVLILDFPIYILYISTSASAQNREK